MIDLAFHHFGVAAKLPEQAIKLLSSLGYRFGEPLLDPYQNVNLIMGEHDVQPRVEIIYPGPTSGPLDRLVEKNPNGIVYHICFVTGDLEKALAELNKAGLRTACISEPKPAPFFPGKKASFYNVVGMGLIEILE